MPFCCLQKQKEELHKRIIKLEKQLVAKQAGEIEVERLRVTMKQIEEEANQEVLQKVDTLLMDLREKEEKYEDLVALNQTLIVKERKSNDELQEALKELVNVCQVIWFHYTLLIVSIYSNYSHIYLKKKDCY